MQIKAPSTQSDPQEHSLFQTLDTATLESSTTPPPHNPPLPLTPTAIYHNASAAERIEKKNADECRLKIRDSLDPKE